MILELCIDSKLSTCPLHDCVRNVIKVVFQCYFGYEIERVPSNFGDVRVPFVVLTSMSPWVRGFFLVSHVERGFLHIFWCWKNTAKTQYELLAARDGKTDLTVTLEKGYCCAHSEGTKANVTSQKAYQIIQNVEIKLSPFPARTQTHSYSHTTLGYECIILPSQPLIKTIMPKGTCVCK